MELLWLKFEENKKPHPTQSPPHPPRQTLRFSQKALSSTWSLELTEHDWKLLAYFTSFHLLLSFYNLGGRWGNWEQRVPVISPWLLLEGEVNLTTVFGLFVFSLYNTVWKQRERYLTSFQTPFQIISHLNMLNCKENGICHILLDYFINWRKLTMINHGGSDSGTQS